MKLWVMSDLHFEFHPDEGARFLAGLPDIDHDAAVIAGDLCDYSRLGKSLSLVGERFKRVAYVIGNHECYGASIDEAHALAQQMSPHNVYVLRRERVALPELFGCSLWFPQDPEKHSRHEETMTDFFAIRKLRETVGQENTADVKFLTA